MDETKHVIVFNTAYFEVVVSHGYFDLLTYATSHSVINRVEYIYNLLEFDHFDYYACKNVWKFQPTGRILTLIANNSYILTNIS
jgi:hypothetical protein